MRRSCGRAWGMLSGQGAAPAAWGHLHPTQPVHTAIWLQAWWRAITQRVGLGATLNGVRELSSEGSAFSGSRDGNQQLGLQGQRTLRFRLSSKGFSKGIVPQSLPFSLLNGTSILYTLKCWDSHWEACKVLVLSLPKASCWKTSLEVPQLFSSSPTFADFPPPFPACSLQMTEDSHFTFSRAHR